MTLTGAHAQVRSIAHPIASGAPVCIGSKAAAAARGSLAGDAGECARAMHRMIHPLFT